MEESPNIENDEVANTDILQSFDDDSDRLISYGDLQSKHDIHHNAIIDSALFRAYEVLREHAVRYNLQHELAIPRIVFVGDTSSGKSMLIQMFLQFPCTFSHANVGTRCPVQYKLRYDPKLADGAIRFINPSNWRAEDLGKNLQLEMSRIENDSKSNGGFREEPFVIEIASKKYTDIEILDVPGLVSGDRDVTKRTAVERITQKYVRDQNFMIVQLKEAQQLVDNTYGTRRIGELCTEQGTISGDYVPPRDDYTQHTITVQTKFDAFIREHVNGTDTNRDIQTRLDAFPNTYFTNMVFDNYNFADHTYQENVDYIGDVPQIEEKFVDDWIANIDKEARKSGSKYELFNRRYRPYIGINVVRKQIQELWSRAFRAALPKLQKVIDQLIEKQTKKFDSALFDLEQQNPDSVRNNYQKFIESFRTSISNYAAYRAEVNILFPLEDYGRTYEEIEKEYNNWNRKQQLTWRAFLTADELKQHPNKNLEKLTTLELPYVGARHFERLRQVFSYMIFSHDPLDRGRAWIESSQSLLYGGISDYENAEKGVRESLFTFIRETFLIGICWLTQMYTFLADHFSRHVKAALLETEFSYLEHHVKFLALVDLEYHTVTRKFIRDSIEAIHHARYARMVYVAHDVLGTLKNLVHSITRIHKNDEDNSDTADTITSIATGTISNLSSGQPLTSAIASSVVNTVVKKQEPLKLIYSASNFLRSERNPQTADYLPQTHDTVHELYTTVRGQLLYDIMTFFFANLVTKIQEYKSIPIDNALQYRIYRMTDKEIRHMANIETDRSSKMAADAHEQLKSLEQARDAIGKAVVVMNDQTAEENYSESDDDDRKERIRATYERTREKRLKDIQKKLKASQRHRSKGKRAMGKQNDDQKSSTNGSYDELNSSADTQSDDEIHVKKTETADDEEELMNYDDKTSSETYLLGVFRKHDKQDLKLGFLPGDSLEADIKFVEERKKQQQRQEKKQSIIPSTIAATVQPVIENIVENVLSSDQNSNNTTEQNQTNSSAFVPDNDVELETAM